LRQNKVKDPFLIMKNQLQKLFSGQVISTILKLQEVLLTPLDLV
jgi:hypothetical protein